jgi:hypothetical protein
VSISGDAGDVATSKSGVCPLREFPCKMDNATVCVPQEKWCDGVKDCPNGLDENIDVCGQCRRFVQFEKTLFSL